MSYYEVRVRVADFGSLPEGSPLLVDVPAAPGRSLQRLHRLAAASLGRLAAAAKVGMGLDLLAASGWRPHRWSSRAQYEQFLVAHYGSVARGRLFLAFDSPHETGLAVDLGCGGLEPCSATRDQQRRTPLHRWLVENAWEFGWHPYLVEPWHWEHWVSQAAYESGTAAPDDAATAPPPEAACEGDACVEAPLDDPARST
jgi:LAS superfamily LD-carboxypeptidase LdcB